jgi:hypothetical protein
MPIEIKELHIRVAVTPASSAQVSGSQAAAAGRGDAGEGAAAEREAIVSECVEQVMHILQQKTER